LKEIVIMAPRVFEVVGDDDVDGDIMGDIMGGEMATSTGAEMVSRPVGRVTMHKPDWRARQMAPGVIAPDQGLLPLPLTGSGGTNTFTATLASITFQGQLQKPFRGERLLVTTVRTGASAVGRLVSQLFVGTDLQQLDVQGFDAEQVGAITGFGIRLTMKPAQPGVFIRLITTLNVVLTGTDTIATTITVLGRNIH
jgi:hypothetical protein